MSVLFLLDIIGGSILVHLVAFAGAYGACIHSMFINSDKGHFRTFGNTSMAGSDFQFKSRKKKGKKKVPLSELVMFSDVRNHNLTLGSCLCYFTYKESEYFVSTLYYLGELSGAFSGIRWCLHTLNVYSVRQRPFQKMV